MTHALGSNTWTVRRFAALLAVPVIATACSSTDGTGAAALSPSQTATSLQTPPADQSAAQESAMTTIRITIDGQTVTAHLADNPTARDLEDQLPVTLTFRDLNQVEKIAKLPRPLTMEGVPEGDDPEIADIGYYAPSQDLVLYYGDVGYWNGIARIGRFSNDALELISRHADDFQVTIERG